MVIGFLLNIFSKSNNNDLIEKNKSLLGYVQQLTKELRKKEKDFNVLTEDFYALSKISYILGLHFAPTKLSDENLKTYKDYLAAKEEKDFAKSDELRKILIERNVL